jgi:hypothetical protein
VGGKEEGDIMNRFILGIDPSGNFAEGKGVTGWVLLDSEDNKIVKHGSIHASDFKSVYAYWNKHVELIDALAGYRPTVVIEDYRLYHNRAMNQVNSLMETPRLIGVLTYECFVRNMWTELQLAVTVKTRWSDEILVKKKYLTQKGKKFFINDSAVHDHIRDALRHAVHHKTFRKEGKKHETNPN